MYIIFIIKKEKTSHLQGKGKLERVTSKIIKILNEEIDARKVVVYVLQPKFYAFKNNIMHYEISNRHGFRK